MLKNAALDAKIGVDTAENELQKGSENGYSKGPRWLYDVSNSIVDTV